MGKAIVNSYLALGSGLSVPFALCSITEEDHDVHFVRVSPDLNPVERRSRGGTAGTPGTPGEPGTSYLADAVTGEEITDDQLVYAVQGLDGDYYRVPAEVAEELKHRERPEAMEIEAFVSVGAIPWERARKSYYIAPQARSHPMMRRPLKLLYEGLSRTQTAAVVRLIPKSKEALAVIYAKHGGLMVTCLAWATEFAQAYEVGDALAGVELREDAVALVEQIIDAMRQPVEILDTYEDSILARKREIRDLALSGEAISIAEKPETTPVLDGAALIDALRASVKQARASKPKTSRGKSRRTSPDDDRIASSPRPRASRRG